MKDLIAIAIGAGFGGSLRHLISLYSQKVHWNGVLLSNLLGCLCMGYILSSEKIPAAWKPFLTIGVLGGLTTFSSFAAQTMELIQQQKYWSLTSYLFVSVLIGVLCCFLSFKTTQALKW